MKALPEKTSRAQQRLLDSSRQALELRRQLAVTWLAAEDIIQAMRALRAGIIVPAKITEQDDQT